MKKKTIVILTIILLILILGYFAFRPIKMTGNVVGEYTLKSIGFDPGLTISKIATAYRGHKYDFDSCPNLPNNKCYGNVAAGSGFYSLEPYFGNTGNFDNECHINSGENYTYYYSWSGTTQQNVSCPYYFNWKTENQNLIANLKIDSSKFKKSEDTYFMLNMQETGHKTGLLWNQYWGIKEDWQNDYKTFPYIKNLSKITFDLRSKICYKATENDQIRIGRVYHYFTFYDSSKNNWQTIALDLFNFKKVPAGSSWSPDNSLIAKTIAFENNLAGCTSEDCNKQQDRWRIIQVNAKYLGVLNYDSYVDNTLDCSVPIENVPWTKVDIEVQKLLNDLVSLGFVNQSLLENGRFVSRIPDDSLVYNQNWPQYQTITLGMETYGRFLLESEIKNRTLWSEESIPPISTCTSFTYSSWTTCNSSALQTRTITSQSPSGCTGGTPASLIQQCLPPCVLSNWQATDSVCSSSNILTRTWTKIGNCNQTIGVSKPNSETISCAYVPNVITCDNFTYSDWSECLPNGIQNRTLISSSPENCQAGNTILVQSCNYSSPTIDQTEQANVPSDPSTPSSQPTTSTNSNYPPASQYMPPVIDQSVNDSSRNWTKAIDISETKVSFLKKFFCKLFNLFSKQKYENCIARDN